MGEHVAQEALRKRETAKLKTRYAKAVTVAQRATEVRRALPPGTSHDRQCKVGRCSRISGYAGGPTQGTG
ncbi:hypothetical protein GCM10025857_35400 [Alicyclobacillus contaminans]|nr:hypothetical protein GCM10025857_35400 [Alicyclobacillus contaminans]